MRVPFPLLPTYHIPFRLSSVCIILGAVTLCAWDPKQPDTSFSNAAIDTTCLVITAIYAVEMFSKMIVFGLWGPSSYLSDRWNWLDAIVVAAGFAVLIPAVRHLQALRTLRAAKWIVTQSPGARVVLTAAFYALPGLAGVLALSAMTYLVFGLAGVQLWAGVLRGACAYRGPDDGLQVFDSAGSACSLNCSAYEGGLCTPSFGDQCQSTFAVSTAGGSPTVLATPMFCAAGPNPQMDQASFDNVGRAILLAYVMVTKEGW